MWKYQTKGTLISSAALAGGTLYTASTDGKAYAFHDTRAAPPADPASLSRASWGQFRVDLKEDSVVGVVAQKGSDVAGVVRLKSGLRGTLQGKLQGTQTTFGGSVGEPDCPARLSGTASTSPTAVHGRFQGQDCKGQPVQGTFKRAP